MLMRCLYSLLYHIGFRKSISYSNFVTYMDEWNTDMPVLLTFDTRCAAAQFPT